MLFIVFFFYIYVFTLYRFLVYIFHFIERMSNRIFTTINDQNQSIQMVWHLDMIIFSLFPFWRWRFYFCWKFAWYSYVYCVMYTDMVKKNSIECIIKIYLCVERISNIIVILWDFSALSFVRLFCKKVFLFIYSIYWMLKVVNILELDFPLLCFQFQYKYEQQKEDNFKWMRHFYCFHIDI